MRKNAVLISVSLCTIACLATGCATGTNVSELTVRDAIERYTDRTADVDRTSTNSHPLADARQLERASAFSLQTRGTAINPTFESDTNYLTLSLLPQDQQPKASQQAAASIPEGYWRKNLWHQMGHEARDFGGHTFWRGFKTSFWDVENALLLTAAMGASVTIRETGVDDTIRRRIDGHRQLGDFDEPIQLLGNPATHFAGAGVVWLASTLTKDEKQHEFAKALTQALAVNGVSTMALKAATNTHSPDGEGLAWPSGHTSSAFTVAAVVNEYYGPLAGVPCFALAGLVGYQRLDSRVHDFSDVVFGAMLGYVVGTSIARDEQAQFPEIFGMKLVPFADAETGATGFALMKSW